jgi:penicillin amidase
MTSVPTAAELGAAVPEVSGRVEVAGLEAGVEIWRDADGIPHVLARSTRDAFLAQGFVHAQDRLWQMEYDRRRAYGRWAEYAGPAGLAQDVLLRRFSLGPSVRIDYAHASAEARAMLDAFAAGVNAFLATTSRWPIEFRLLDTRPEPWKPWDSIAVFKVRHLDMGPWQLKAWRARLLRQLGAERAAALCPGLEPAPMLIVPPGVEWSGELPRGLEAFLAGATVLDGLPEEALGSNNWALAGQRTASGKPLVAGDPHRSLDVPNVYYQNHVACPDFDAIGLSFPGVPGLPHFGHNAHVAWCVTHAMADYQDLFIERFDPADPARYEFRGQWRRADQTRETIRVRDAAAVEIDVTVTHHGPVVIGDPGSGHALACRYSATATPNSTFDCFVPMLGARSADDLEAAMRRWVEPGNNLVYADVHGAFGYRCRGQVPKRAAANAWLPVPGWTGEHEWQGMIPFDEMPAVRNPATGFVASANARITGPEYSHYIGLDFAPDSRTRRVVERLRSLERASVADMASVHADRVSLPARALIGALATLGLGDSPALAAQGPGQTSGLPSRTRAALERLLAWDGVMQRDAVEPLLYAAFRERLLRDLMTPLLGPLAPQAFATVPGGPVTHMARLRTRLANIIQGDDRTWLPAGASWPDVLAAALDGTLDDLTRALGSDIESWRWGRLHATRPRHPLSLVWPGLAPALDPPSLPMGGDGDTVQAAAFVPAAGYSLTNTSVARYVFDLGDWERSRWIIPLGASGHPGSPHFADQAADWAETRLRPMRYGWLHIRAEAESHQILSPAIESRRMR